MVLLVSLCLGYVHRDLKPENVLFQDKSPQSPIKIIDFGKSVLDVLERWDTGTTRRRADGHNEGRES